MKAWCFIQIRVKDHLSISGDEVLEVVQLFNSMGQLLITYNPATSKIIIDMSLYNPGVYIVKTINQKGIPGAELIIKE